MTKSAEQCRLEYLQRELDAVYNSDSYKIGRAVTWLPRKVQSITRCIRENGVGGGYTVLRQVA